VQSRDEVRAILQCVRIELYRVCLTTIYACGLRLPEGTELPSHQVDSALMQLHIVGKGNKDRNVPLSAATILMLREVWRTHRSPRWLFPARTGGGPAAQRPEIGRDWRRCGFAVGDQASLQLVTGTADLQGSISCPS
jgi:site-specific recombinase XerD